MKTNLTLTMILAAIIVLLNNQMLSAQFTIGSTKIDTLSVITGLDTPWEILWGPDEHIWLTERRGVVSRLNPQTKQLQQLLSIPDVYEANEAGLMGMVLHPDFSTSPYVYLIYVFRDGTTKKRLMRYTYNGTSLTNPLVLIDNIFGAEYHVGARLVIDNNLKLFVSLGDATNLPSAQNVDWLPGKILRLNLDGTIPSDNPISNNYLWTMGHRNPQGLVIAPDGKMYSSEHGPSTDDELNLILKGRNYGWSTVNGFCDLSAEQTFCQANNVVEPLMAWTPTIAPAGIDYYNSNAIPEWKNNILMTTLKGSALYSLKMSPNGLSVESSAIWFKNNFGRLRDICLAPDGRVFIATSNRDGRGTPKTGDDRIIQLKATNTSNIDSGKKDNVFTIYPNPLVQSTTIKIADSSGLATLSVYNISGKLIFTDVIEKGLYTLNRKQLSSGTYIVNIRNKTTNSSQPLFVK